MYADHQTFWFYKKSNYFLLSKTSPELFNNPRFFLWDPKALCNDIPCLNCHHPLQWHGHIEGHSFNFRQHMAILSADICALDHSHKVMLMLLCDSCIAFSSLSCQITKHLARIDGEQIFTGLLSLTNELGQIQACNLVATTSHSQFELSINGIQKLLNLYSHSQPQLIYTDTMADKQFLECCFPLL